MKLQEPKRDHNEPKEKPASKARKSTRGKTKMRDQPSITEFLDRTKPSNGGTQGIGHENFNYKLTHIKTHPSAREREREGLDRLTHTIKSATIINPNPRNAGGQGEPQEDRQEPEP